MTATGPATIEYLLRDLAPQVLGTVMRRHRDFAQAEDAVQEALLAAATQWPADGVPENPRAWLVQVALRRMADRIRDELARRRREAATIMHLLPDEALAPAPDADDAGRDDTLLLLFMCCHPALTPATAVALTLRAVGGLTTAQIANAFLVPEATMAQRISRAKLRIKESGVPFEEPGAAERDARFASVLQVLYLVFNEGYASSIGEDLQRGDLAHEAIRLTRAVLRLRPDECEAAGLLALMLLTDARRDARTGPRGELVPLAEQDRSRWDRRAIAEGVALISRALPRGKVGPYQLQAAIAAVHDEAATVADTDWPQILALYDLLARMTGNPMIALNRAVALAMVRGPQAGLAVLKILDDDQHLAGHYRLDAVRAHLHELAGERDAAVACYRAAAARTASVPERDYLGARAMRLAADGN